MRTLLTCIMLCLMWGSPTIALTKEDAQACVTTGISTFLEGRKISHLIDIPFMRQREKINAPTSVVEELLNEHARGNQGYYRGVSATVVGVPQAKSSGFFLVAGTIRGEATKSLRNVRWRTFSYQYIIWLRKQDDTCLIGVLAIEEMFRLAGWVKSKL